MAAQLRAETRARWRATLCFTAGNPAIRLSTTGLRYSSRKRLVLLNRVSVESGVSHPSLNIAFLSAG